jgi:hypothetical protein
MHYLLEQFITERYGSVRWREVLLAAELDLVSDEALLDDDLHAGISSPGGPFRG